MKETIGEGLMGDLRVEVPHSPQGVLDAVSSATLSPGQAQRATAVYLLAQVYGWNEVWRLHRSTGRSTFYRYLQLLSDAGLPVPLRDHKHRTGRSVNVGASLHGLMDLVGQRFPVVESVSDAPGGEFDAGVEIEVEAVQFQDGYWLVGVSNTAEKPRGMYSRELWPVADFVRACGLTVEAVR